ncbi:hypothetical protein TWF694_003182 [Orbilia ellipsospora]|uniref:cellulase n=1 Tax=Orbilia ellipsospora TaxID=2528407 RepID=A0AAV9X0V6_9PEZI
MVYQITSLLAAVSFSTLTGYVWAGNVLSGTSISSMYYDCCKPACAWNTAGPSYLATNLQVCDANDNIITDDPLSAASYCDGGPATACTTQQPWAVNDTFAYGFASVFIAGDQPADWCCSCYELEFLNSTIKGKKMIVQSINVNYNENQENYFSLTVPGQADWADKCAQRFGGDFGTFLGKNSTGGVANITQCNTVPESLQPGCEWRYGWYENVQLPSVAFQRVQCPTELVQKTGCTRLDEHNFAPASSNTLGNVSDSSDTKTNSAPSSRSGLSPLVHAAAILFTGAFLFI